jgi:S1-C subfamily serine protease
MRDCIKTEVLSMGKTIIVFEDGRVVDTIEETNWEGVKIENGRLVADVPESPATAGAETEAVAGTGAETGTAPETGAAAETAPESAPVFPPAAPQDAPPSAAEPEARTVPEAAGISGGEQTAGTGTEERLSAPHTATAESADAKQYPWRGETAYGDTGRTPGHSGPAVDAKKVIAVILGLVLATGAGFGGGIAAVNTGAVALRPSSQQITINPTDQVSTTEAVAAKVSPSVVGITSMTTRTIEVPLFGGAYENKSGGVGTGIIVDESGYILTNSHVVLDGEVDTLTVLLPDGRDVEGDVLWTERGLDLAIVKVKAGNLVAAELGDSDNIKLGSYVAAIGNPMGLDFRGSISQGVVSGLDRAIVAVSEYDSRNNFSLDDPGYVPMEGLIQVDAAINVGNSGGPLINSLGQVIGVNTARNQNGEGMGFAIPINTAKPIVDSIKSTGEFHRVYIGVTPSNVSDWLRSYPQSDLGVKSGAYVNSVTPGSPAEAAGIKAKDVIVGIDGMSVDTSLQLIKHLLGYRTGDVAEVEVVRDKRHMTFKVTLTDSL